MAATTAHSTGNTHYTMKLRLLTLRPQPSPARGFFKLPRELRDVIYGYCLLELPKWERRHGANCPHVSRDCTTYERPPFAYYNPMNAKSSCPCATRRGLTLLLANRQVHGEAAPVFWSGNIFCWGAYSTFAVDIADKIRPEYRLLLRHASILTQRGEVEPPSGSTYWGNNGHVFEPFWKAVHLCTGLRTLEVKVEYVRNSADMIAQIPDHCPQLELSLVRLHSCEERHALMQVEPRILWFKTARKLDPSSKRWNSDFAKEAARDFETNFLIHARFAIDNQILARQKGAEDILNKLDDTTGPQSLKLRDGTTIQVPIYGLPLSRATRFRHARERIITDVKLKKAGKLTAAETRLKEERASHRRGRVDQNKLDIEAAVEANRSRRVVRQTLGREEEAEAMLKQREAERAEFEARKQEAIELRLAERKRGSKKARSGFNLSPT